MRYEQTAFGIFIERPNRFIARVQVDGKEEICHVRTTGRCGELFVPGAKVVLEKSDSPNRKTRYSVVAVYRGALLVNIDSQMPNKLFAQWVGKGRFWPQVRRMKAEYAHGDSRFDFYLEAGEKRTLVEVKGVTLKVGRTALFPDAPTKRGLKHLKGLLQAVKEGYEAYAVFVVQMQGARVFMPNEKCDPAFARALREAQAGGVHIAALECRVAPQEIYITGELPVSL
ncbi:MAG: DNA/RNA nuclease SfsA [Christensenellales bacterium]|jgi:sugar fermentation stimulation protein A